VLLLECRRAYGLLPRSKPGRPSETNVLFPRERIGRYETSVQEIRCQGDSNTPNRMRFRSTGMDKGQDDNKQNLSFQRSKDNRVHEAMNLTRWNQQ
jgi:hypothetical protein